MIYKILFYFLCYTLTLYASNYPQVATAQIYKESRDSKEVEIINIFGFTKAPKVNDEVTIIPLGVDAKAFSKKILSVTKGKRAEEDFFDIKLEAIYDQRLMNLKSKATMYKDTRDEYRYQIAIIYPAQKYAKHLNTWGYIHHNVYNSTVNDYKIKIDLNNDNKEDVIISNYPCTQDSEYSCGDTKYKVQDSFISDKWVIINSYKPM